MARLQYGIHVRVLSAGTSLIRVHRSENGPFWFGPAPGKTATGRWDAPSGQYRTMYAGLTVTAAFSETVLHRPAGRMIKRDAIVNRSKTTIEVTRDLRLAHFHGAGLLKNGLSAADVSNQDYDLTQALALEVHAGDRETDGVIYRSSHDDDHLCVALFHDRVSEADDLRIGQTVSFADWGDANWIPLLEEHGALLEPDRPLPSTDEAILEERRHGGEIIPRR